MVKGETPGILIKEKIITGSLLRPVTHYVTKKGLLNLYANF